MTYLYNRRVIVDIGTLRVEGLNVSFDIAYEGLDFGKAEIKIFNLNRTNRKQIEESGTSSVSLSIGYENTPMDQIFKGEMRRSFSAKDGSDWVTTLQTGDGDKAAKARINRSYRAGTPKQAVLNDLLKNLNGVGIDAGNAKKAFASGSYKDGIDSVLSSVAKVGGTYDILKDLGRSAGLNVQVQDGELVVTKVGEPLEASAIVLSPSTGLIGTPQRGVKKEAKIKALIMPGLRPKRLVQVESPTLTGLYIIAKSKYKGEARGNDWYVDLECVER